MSGGHSEYDYDQEFDMGGHGSAGPDIYADTADFNLEDSLPDFLPSPTATTPTSAPLAANSSNGGAAGAFNAVSHQNASSHAAGSFVPYAGSNNGGNFGSESTGGYQMTHQLPPKPDLSVVKTEVKTEPMSITSVGGAGVGRTAVKDDRQDAGKIFVGGLNWETTDESLRAHFSKWGEILDCSVMKEPGTGKSRGFGFLTYADPAAIPAMLEQEHVLDGKMVDPKRAIPREEQILTEKIFVGGISPDVSEQEFSDFFNQFGKVIDATLMIDRDTGRPRGFGFITFENDLMVDELVVRRDLAIKGKTVEVKRAMPKHKAQQAKQAKEMAGAFGGNSIIPTFVSDGRTGGMSKAGGASGVASNVARSQVAANPALAAAAALYGAGAGGMGLGGAAAATAAKNWMNLYAAGGFGMGGANGGTPNAAGAFYGFPNNANTAAAAAAYQNMYNPAALAAYYQRLAASGMNWGAAAGAGNRGAGWFPNAGAGTGSVGGYDMYGGNAGGAGGVGAGGYAAMMMGAGAGNGGAGMTGGGAAGGSSGAGSGGNGGGSSRGAGGPGGSRSSERDTASRDPRRRSSRSRSPTSRRDGRSSAGYGGSHSPRRDGNNSAGGSGTGGSSTHASSGGGRDHGRSSADYGSSYNSRRGSGAGGRN